MRPHHRHRLRLIHRFRHDPLNRRRFPGAEINTNLIRDPRIFNCVYPNKIRDAMGIIVGVNLYEQNEKEYIEINVPSYPIGISYKGVLDKPKDVLMEKLHLMNGSYLTNAAMPLFSKAPENGSSVLTMNSPAASCGVICPYFYKLNFISLLDFFTCFFYYFIYIFIYYYSSIFSWTHEVIH